jgi:hypothetical protein
VPRRPPSCKFGAADQKTNKEFMKLLLKIFDVGFAKANELSIIFTVSNSIRKRFHVRDLNNNKKKGKAVFVEAVDALRIVRG